MKKWISRIIDIVLVLFIGLLIYVEASMMITKNKPENYGIPSAFGVSVLYVSTDSMDNIEEDPKGIQQGSGIIIKDVDPEEIVASNPIYSPDDPTKIIDYDKKGDVVTFILVKTIEGRTYKVPDTHRVVHKEKRDGKWWFTTMGDNPKIHKILGYDPEWNEDLLVGKVIFHSLALGSFLTISSPDVAASANKSAWFFPVAMLVPIVVIAISFLVDTVVKNVKENKKREEELQVLMEKAGIDLNDDEAVELFRMKEEMRLDIKEQLEIEMEKAKKKALKEIEKQKKEKNKK